MKKVNYLSLNLLLSYLSILAVPLLAIIIIYFTASDLLLSIQTEKIKNNLNETAQEVDKHLEEAGNLSLYISNSKELNDMVKKALLNPGDVSFYDMYLLSRSFPDYSGFNNAIEEVYLFFAKEDYMMKLPAVVPATNRSYQTIGSLTKDSYENMLQQLESTYYQRKPMSLEKADGSGSRLAIVQSFPYGTYGTPEGAVVILLEDAFVNKMLMTNIIDGEGMTLMLDHENRIQKAAVGERCDLIPEELSVVGEMGEDGIKSLRIGGENYISAISAGGSLYQYVTILPKRVILGQIGYIKYVIVLLCMASVAVGILSCLLLWRKRRGLILAYGRYEAEFGTVVQEERQVKSLWDGMRRVIDYVAEVQATLRLQENFIRSAVMRKLLLGEYQTEEELLKEVGNSGIRLEGKGYITVVISFHKIAQTLQVEKRNEYQLFMKEQIQEKVLLPYYYCEIDQFTAALILPTQAEGSAETIKEIFRQFEDELVTEQYVEVYTAIGKEVFSLQDIALSFEDAAAVCEYSRFHDIRLVMSRGDMPREQESFFFPMETEIHLIRAIKQGNREGLEDLFRLIRFENYTYRTLSLPMIEHLLEMIRCTVIRALREEKDPDCQELVEQIGESAGLDDIYSHLLAIVSLIQKRNLEEEARRTNVQKMEFQQFVETWYHKDDFNLINLADEFGISERKAYNDFKSCFGGVTFSDYLENVRIHKACDLLKQGTAVKDVAVKAGYGSDYSFRRAFKRVMGLAPSYYSEGLTKQ